MKPSYQARIEVKKGSKIYIWYSEWWGDALVIVEGNKVKERYVNDDRINDILDEIADSILVIK